MTANHSDSVRKRVENLMAINEAKAAERALGLAYARAWRVRNKPLFDAMCGARADQNERLREALSEVRDDLHNENRLNTLSIVDTIWHSPIETTVEFIDAVLADDAAGAA